MLTAAVTVALALVGLQAEGGLVLADEGEVTAVLSGRVFLDAGWFGTDGPSYRNDEDGASGLEDATEVRAARLGVHGELGPRLAYRLEYELAAGDEVEPRNAWLAFSGTPLGELRVGHFREPFGLEQATSLRFTTFLERALPDVFAPGFNAGAALHDANAARTLTWSAGLFRTTDASGSAAADGEYALTARLTGTPRQAADGADLVHLGAAVSYRQDDVVRYRPRPEAHLVAPVADTGAIRVDDTTLIGLEAAWVRGPLSLQGEYVIASVNAVPGEIDAEYSGAYAFASWFLTGEHRVYLPERGAFGRVVPHARLGEGPGAIELAARFSLVELDDGPSSDELAGTTFGVNWYLTPHTRVMLDVVRSDYHDIGVYDEALLVLLRFQADW